MQPFNDIERTIITAAGTIAGVTITLLNALADYDTTKGYESWGCQTAAHWLSWQCDWTLSTAREHVLLDAATTKTAAQLERYVRHIRNNQSAYDPDV